MPIVPWSDSPLLGGCSNVFFPKKTREKHAKHRPSLDQSLFPSYFLMIFGRPPPFLDRVGFFPQQFWTKMDKTSKWACLKMGRSFRHVQVNRQHADKHQPDKWRFRVYLYMYFHKKTKQIDGSAQVSRWLTLPEMPHWCLQWLRHHANAPQSAWRSRWCVVFLLFGGYRHP